MSRVSNNIATMNALFLNCSKLYQTPSKPSNNLKKDNMFGNYRGKNSSSNNKPKDSKYLIVNGKKELLTLGKQLGKGGEGTVYLMNNLKGEYVAKIYHKITPNLQQKIEYMTKNKPDQLTGQTFIICWPEYLIQDDNGKFIGYAMRKGFNNSIEIYELTKPKIKNKSFHKFSNEFNGGIINRLKLLINICVPLNYITTSEKYVMVDFKPQNVLTDYNGRISILDTDSFQISENGKILFNARVATPEYTPKEYANVTPSKIKYNKSTDMFAIGVSFYQVLMGIHPYVVRPKNDRLTTIAEYIYADLFAFGNNQDKIISKPPPHTKYNTLPNGVKDLFTKTFTTIHRPPVAEWGKTIAECINDHVNNAKSSTLDSAKVIAKRVTSNYNHTHQAPPPISKMSEYTNTLELLKSSVTNVEISMLRTALQTVRKLGDIAKEAQYKGSLVDKKNYIRMAMALRCCLNILFIYGKAPTKSCMDETALKETIDYISCINTIFKDDLSMSIDPNSLNKLYQMKCSSIDGAVVLKDIKAIIATSTGMIKNNNKKTFYRNYNNYKLMNTDDPMAILSTYKDDNVVVTDFVHILIGALNSVYTAKYNAIDATDSEYK